MDIFDRDFTFFLVVLCVWVYSWSIRRRILRSERLIERAEGGDRSALSELIELDIHGENGVLLVAGNDLHKMYTGSGRTYHVAASPSCAFLSLYKSAVEMALLRAKEGAAREEARIRRLEEKGDFEAAAREGEAKSLLERKAASLVVVRQRISLYQKMAARAH